MGCFADLSLIVQEIGQKLMPCKNKRMSIAVNAIIMATLLQVPDGILTC